MTVTRYDEDTIECLLTPEDLKERSLEIAMLTYSSPVLKSLTADLLRFLRKKYDFKVDKDEPVSIEAVPMSDGCLAIIFSKNAYADDIDPRYSVFSDPDPSAETDDSEPVTVQDAIHRMIESVMNTDNGVSQFLLHCDSTDKESSTTQGVFVFDSFADILHLFSVLSESVPMSVSVYRSEKKAYMVIFHFYHVEDDDLEALVSLICEYGMIRQMAAGTESYIAEHCEMIMPQVPFIIAKKLISSK